MQSFFNENFFFACASREYNNARKLFLRFNDREGWNWFAMYVNLTSQPKRNIYDTKFKMKIVESRAETNGETGVALYNK